MLFFPEDPASQPHSLTHALTRSLSLRGRGSSTHIEDGLAGIGIARLAQTVQRVLGVYKLEEFGVPEAMWVIEVKNFPVVVTMDSHGQSKHSLLEESSGKVLEELLARPY